MKRLVVVLSLLICAQAHAGVQTWQFKDASLFADDSDFALYTGPVGTLTGRFDYDTATHTITAFLLNAGGALFSSNTPELVYCPLIDCTGTASVQTPTKLVFDEQLTPASNERLELFLSEPLDGAPGKVALDPSSVIYYNYGLATIHVTGGELTRSSSPLFNAPEPATYAELVFGLAAVVLVGRVRRSRGPLTPGRQVPRAA